MNSSVATLPRLSWSQISTYTQCPAKWWFSRRYPPECTPSALKFGTAIHKAVQVFYAALAEGYHAGLDELLAAYLDRWEEPSEAPIHFGKDESPDSLKGMAERMLGTFLKTVQPGKVLAIEQGFAVEIARGNLVSGYVDLLEAKDEKLWIVDHKTGKNSPSDPVCSTPFHWGILASLALGHSERTSYHILHHGGQSAQRGRKRFVLK